MTVTEILWNATLGEHSFGWLIVGAPNIQISMIGGGTSFAERQPTQLPASILKLAVLAIAASTGISTK